MTPWVTRLIFANAGMFFASSVMPQIVLWLALVPAWVLVRPWSPFTYMFLHADLWHLLFNMLGLFFFGPRLEARLGGRRFLGLYFVSGLVGALLSVVTPYARIIGASGAVFGVFFAFAYFWPRERVWIWGIFPVEARVLVVAFTAFTLWAGFQGGSGVAHFAHLGGFLGGWMYLKLSDRFSAAQRFKQKAAPAPSRPTGDGDVLRWQRIDRNDLHPVNREELDRVLDKISSEGLKSLTAAERAFLERFSTK
jgi:membrane associated rhomboid family serine protease